MACRAVRLRTDACSTGIRSPKPVVRTRSPNSRHRRSSVASGPMPGLDPELWRTQQRGPPVRRMVPRRLARRGHADPILRGSLVVPVRVTGDADVVYAATRWQHGYGPASCIVTDRAPTGPSGDSVVALSPGFYSVERGQSEKVTRSAARQDQGRDHEIKVCSQLPMVWQVHHRWARHRQAPGALWAHRLRGDNRRHETDPATVRRSVAFPFRERADPAA